MPTPFNPGAIRIGVISNAAQLQVTTIGNHNFVDGTMVVLNIPNVDGMLPPSYVDNQYILNHIVLGPIIITGLNSFTIDESTANWTPFNNIQPAYAIPWTYICYANPSPTFQPAYRLITAISNARRASITTSFDHDFYTGTVVRLMIPDATGMGAINQSQGTVTVTSPTTFTIDIDTTYVNAFAIPTVFMSSDPHVDICALVVPIGEDNSILYAATQNVL